MRRFAYNYCVPPVSYTQNEGGWQDSTAPDLSGTGLSSHDAYLTRLLGISGYIHNLWLLKQDSLQDNTSRQLLLRQKIGNRLLLAQAQIQAVAAELECDAQRSSMAADYLDAINNKKITRITIASVIAGGLTTVGTSVISKQRTLAVVGISGGLVSAGLSTLLINPKGKTVVFDHQRNLLRTIWSDTSSNTDYPPFVWQMLHDKFFRNKDDITIAQSIKNRWVHFEFDNKISSTQELLLFGAGGSYEAGDLHLRASMINQLQSAIRSLNQDLMSIVAYIDRI